MSDPSTSSQHSHGEDAPQDGEAITEAEAVPPPYPAVGLPASACHILRPLSQVASQHSFPLPSSGSLASLAKQQSQQQIETSRASTTHEKSLQSDSGTNATADSFDSESIRMFTAAAWHQQYMPNQSMPAFSLVPSPPSSPSKEQLPGNSDEKPSHHFSPSPYASIFPEGTDSSPLFIHRCDEYETTNDDSVRKYSESLQLFRRKGEEDEGKIWARRVIEYR